MQKLKLGVNIDHVATFRQARGGMHPSPLEAALICKKAGADSIVMHLREDRRHIQDDDLFQVRDEVDIRLNLEMSIAESVVQVATKLAPDQVTLVPERRAERTTESGLNLFSDKKRLENAMNIFRKKGIEVSLFIDPDRKSIEGAKAFGAQAVEFHTGDYANQTKPSGQKQELQRIIDAVSLAESLDLKPYAGHGLDYKNVIPVKKIEGLLELNIGYSIITRALWVGLEGAVIEMKRLIQR